MEQADDFGQAEFMRQFEALADQCKKKMEDAISGEIVEICRKRLEDPADTMSESERERLRLEIKAYDARNVKK